MSKLRIAAAGTHPFTHWGNVGISAGNQRYERLIADFRGTGLTVGPHPMAYHRRRLDALRILRGEPAGGVADLHLHPVEPRALRLTLATSY